MADTDSDYDDEEEAMHLTYGLHNAAESGDAAALEALLGLAADVEAAPQSAALMRRMLHMTDSDECTPLHLAIINGHARCVDLLLCAGSSVAKDCDGNLPLHLAAALGQFAQHGESAAAIVSGLLEHGADPHDRDDGGRTALHWAAVSGLPKLATLLLVGARAVHASKLAALAADMEVEGAAAPPLQRPEHILAAVDHDGHSALHLAARAGHGPMTEALLKEEAASAQAVQQPAAGVAGAGAGVEGAAAAAGGTSSSSSLMPVADVAALCKAKSREGFTPLHLAALHGRGACAAALLAASPSCLALADKKGRSAADLAARRGHAALADALRAAAAGQEFVAPPPEAPGQGEGAGTLLLAPDQCLLHRTAPEPIVRGGQDPPPENVNRLHVTTRPGRGSLHASEFSGLHWRTSGIPPVAMVDLLKCHDWAYVQRILKACSSIEDSPGEVDRLDPDTAISHGTAAAALAAAGAVCAAVDEVMGAKARNVFCAVRPPGHHAGPTGVVSNSNDQSGSHGFCLFSNVAIGAAYAMSVYRHAGIRRVAILDFDVHHGNGTQACVLNTVPGKRSVSLVTPFSQGSQTFPVYKPWLGEGDAHNILFASVQGYGRRSAVGGWFYPGSGATADSALVEQHAAAASAGPAAQQQPADTKAASAATDGSAPAASAAAGIGGDVQAQAPAAPADLPAQLPAAPAADAAGGPVAAAAGMRGDSGAAGRPPAAGVAAAASDGRPVPEDPDGEFAGSTDTSLAGGPRVINVGIPGPGGKPRMWRRAWRDKILPTLYNFKPDIILVSAGFDAHKKEDLNLRYVGVTEADYEWLTNAIVEVANACCGGRVVSVLEGGYNLRGGAVGSAFARSVAAHVRAMSSPTTARYDPSEAEAERHAEKAVEARKAMKAAGGGLAALASSAGKARAAAAQAAAAAAPAAAMAAAAVPASEQQQQAQEPAGAAGGDGDEPAGKRRRRGGPIDYAALNSELEAERQRALTAGQQPAAQ